MKILILSADFPTWDGGVAVWAEKSALHLQHLGHEVTVVTPRQRDLADDQFDLSCPYGVIRLKNVKDRYKKYFKYRYDLWKLLRREQFDLFLSASSWFPFANAVMHLAPQTPLYTIVHGNDFLEKRWFSFFWKPRMQRAFTHSKGIIAVSEETRRRFLEIFSECEKKTCVIPPGVDTEDFSGKSTFPPAENPILLTVGRIVERKGHDRVLQALPLVMKEFPHLRYIIAGRGSYLQTLERMTRELHLEKNVQFEGFISQERKSELLHQCTAYIMPSRTIDVSGDLEGYGITYLEANACGRPVIGSNEGGPAEAIQDRITGLQANPHSIEDIAEKILTLLRDPAYAQRLGQQGLEWVQAKANWAARIQKLNDFFPR